MLLILMRKRGHTRAYDAIEEEYLEIMGYRLCVRNMNSSLKRLREQLDGRLIITTTYSIGLKLEEEP